MAPDLRRRLPWIWSLAHERGARCTVVHRLCS